MERLKKGVYGDIYNYPFKKYEELLGRDDLKASEEEEELEVEEEEEMEEVFLRALILFLSNKKVHSNNMCPHASLGT